MLVYRPSFFQASSGNMPNACLVQWKVLKLKFGSVAMREVGLESHPAERQPPKGDE